MRILRYFAIVALIAYPSLASADQTATVELGIGLVAGSLIPATTFEQTYYLGIFDPREQVPESFYRIRVRGQSSFFNTSTRYASGWVPAGLVDTLATRFDFDNTTGNVAYPERGNDNSSLKLDRRLVLFGPEGFREAPANHRLVIIMGANPHAFFEAVNSVLSDVGQNQLHAIGTTFFHDELLPDLKAVIDHMDKIK